MNARHAALVAQLSSRQLTIVEKLADRAMFTHPEAIRMMNIADFALMERIEVIIPTSFQGKQGWRVRDSFRPAAF